MKPKNAGCCCLALMLAACGGGGGPLGPSTPGVGGSGALAGTWHGTITFTKPAPMTVPTTWTFTPMADTARLGFEVKASWSSVTTRAMTATLIGSQFSANGVYPSPLGCDGIVGGYGNGDPHQIDATFNGSSSCDSVFEGHLILTR